MNSVNGIINAATLKRPGEHSASRAAPDDSPPPYLLPRFKPEWLPQPFRHFAMSLAVNLGVPLEMVALQALALPSVLAGHAIDVEPREGWVEPATIYAVTIANTGAGKSPAMKRFTGFIMRAEKDRRETARQHHQERVRELEAVVTTQGEDAAEAKDEVARLRKAGPPSPRLHVTDATDERLATLMEANNGPVAVWAAEPKFFRVAAGAYSKTGPATDVMLQALQWRPHPGRAADREVRLRRPAPHHHCDDDAAEARRGLPRCDWSR